MIDRMTPISRMTHGSTVAANMPTATSAVFSAGSPAIGHSGAEVTGSW
jgi:hypothetical protein